MITEHDLQEAILECQGQRNPTATTCIKLAAFLIIKRELYPDKNEQEPEPFKEPPTVYSYAQQPEPAGTVTYESGTEFSELINGRNQEDVWPVIDELMDVLHAVNQRLYDGVMRKLDQ